MSVSGWIFMVGFRVVDVALLGGWLFWFFRRLLDDDGDDDERWDDGGAPPEPDAPPPAGPWPRRLRDHGDNTRREPTRRGVPVTHVTREPERTF